MPAELLTVTDRGLYCAAGDFFIDPWRPVPRAVVTHAHADHARRGSDAYLAAAPSLPLLARRLGESAAVEGLAFGETTRLGDAIVSFHPAGHVRGSAQVRVESAGEVWVVSGDYKRAADPTCEPFEPVACDVFITEATFALPVYRWQPAAEVAAEILAWWRENAEAGRASLLLTYALGKAQRVLAELAAFGERTVFTHGAVEALCEVYRQQGVRMLPTRPVAGEEKGRSWAGELIVAPPSAYASPWSRRFGDLSAGFASGWMRVRGPRRRRGFDRGFVLSDHADWPDLLTAIEATGAGRVLTTHGYAAPLARFLREDRGLDAAPLDTRARGEGGDGSAEDGGDGEESGG